MQDILDIKSILDVSLLALWVAVSIFLFLILAITILIFWFRKRRKTPPKPVVTSSPRDKALQALKSLDTARWLEQGQFRKYYFSLSDILRTFLEEEFKIPAVETTTEEVRPHLMNSEKIPPLQRSQILQMLKSMDLVKFAKQTPMNEESLLLRKGIQDFVSNTPQQAAEFKTD